MAFFDMEFLWLVPMVFAIMRIFVGIFGYSFFNSVPETKEIEHYEKERSNNLTLAGFSLAAITLFLTLGASTVEQPLPAVSDTTFYLSIALVSFISASYLYTLQTSRWYSYFGDSLELIGLLSVGISLLLFFDFIFTNNNKIEIVYYLFFLFVIGFAAKELVLWVKHFKNLKSTKTSNQ